MNGKSGNSRKSWGYALLWSVAHVLIVFVLVIVVTDTCLAQSTADRTIVQVSPDTRASSGDNNDIIKVSYRSGCTVYGYKIEGTDLWFQFMSLGYNEPNKDGKVFVIIDCLFGYHGPKTSILSVSYSDKREAYLVTIRHDDGEVLAEWVDFKSPVFRECVAMNISRDFGGELAEPRIHGDSLEISDKLAGINFRVEN